MSEKNVDQSILGWIVNNQIKNERGNLVEFDDHYFMIDIYSDWAPKIVCKKSAQVGFSTCAILKSAYAAKYRKWNCIYTLPTFDDVKDFVPSKVDKMMEMNPVIRDGCGDTDAMQKKDFGESFIFYRGTHKEKAAIMHTSDFNVYDEYDSSNWDVIDTYASRLQYSKYKGEYFFSNPTGMPDQGISLKYEQSDQRKWIVTCEHCGEKQELDFFINVDQEKKIFVCKSCHGELSDDTRHDGEWVAQYPGREMHGYHISQLMCPWVSAAELVYLYETKTKKFFYNMVLGLSYVEADAKVDRQMFTKNYDPNPNPKMRNAMGVDVKFHLKHYVIGNRNGIFQIGTVKTWDEIEDLKRKFNCITVADNGPDVQGVRTLMGKYPGTFYACVYKRDLENKNLIRWGSSDLQGKVLVDRSQMIQMVIEEFYESKHKMQTIPEEFLVHWSNIYRKVEPDRYGVDHAVWEKSGDDDFVHATLYWRIALEKVPQGGIQSYQNEKGYPVVIGDSIDAEPILYTSTQTHDWRYT